MSSSENTNTTTDTTTDEEEFSSDDYDFSANGRHLYYHVIRSRYLLLKKIGYGSFSSVWFVLDWTEMKYYAMKIYNDEDFEEGVNEIKILKMITKTNCKYLMSMIDYFIYETKIDDKKYRHPCMVFELMVGSLYELGKYEYEKKGIPMNIIEKIIPQMVEGINVLHKDLEIIHGDLKPENILIRGYCVEIETFINYINGLNLKKLHSELKSLEKVCKYISEKLDDVEVDETKFIDQKYLDNIEICITDFGSIVPKKKFSTEEIMTRYYRGPEILLELKHNFGSDIWALGCLIYELIVGKILFDPDKDDIRSRDYNHILLINQYIGKIPKTMLDGSPLKREFYKRDKLKFDEKVQKYDIIVEEFAKKIKDIEKCNKYIKIVKDMLFVDIFKRNISI
jgi:serine/threonine-protein kinase SRPK3